MSGGHFDYAQFHLGQIAEGIKDVIDKNFVEVPSGDHHPWDFDKDGNIYEDCKYYYAFGPEVIEKFKEGYEILRKAYVYAQRIDWLLSGDDGDKTFLERLDKDLKELNDENQNG